MPVSTGILLLLMLFVSVVVVLCIYWVAFRINHYEQTTVQDHVFSFFFFFYEIQIRDNVDGRICQLSGQHLVARNLEKLDLKPLLLVDCLRLNFFFFIEIAVSRCMRTHLLWQRRLSRQGCAARSSCRFVFRQQQLRRTSRAVFVIKVHAFRSACNFFSSPHSEHHASARRVAF